jgi:hypothetical protein
MDIRESTERYEAWLRFQLGPEVVADDLRLKHAKMAKSAFSFLRAAYWRWAETILTICPDLADGGPVLSVGDIHVENFGTWHDGEGRLVWGVNDFDEAAEMPYVLDLVRLTTSAMLAGQAKVRLDQPWQHVLAGYRKGLRDPKPLVLDKEQAPLRARLAVENGARDKFWNEDFDPKKNRVRALKTRGPKGVVPPSSYVRALGAARPDPTAALVFWARTAGGGSLGRPRWVGYGTWRGSPFVREAKAVVPSSWTLAGDRGPQRLRCLEIARGDYRSPDPCYAMNDSILVRRLSPDNRKLEFKDKILSKLIDEGVLELMGAEVAAVHLGVDNRSKEISRDLEKRTRRNPAWLEEAAGKAAAAVRDDQEKWAKQTSRPQPNTARTGRRSRKTGVSGR